MTFWCISPALLLSICLFTVAPLYARPSQAPQDPPAKASSKPASPLKPSSPDEQLQQAIAKSGNDRAALVRNLRDYLSQYPESPQRPRIYRALVESCMQL